MFLLRLIILSSLTKKAGFDTSLRKSFSFIVCLDYVGNLSHFSHQLELSKGEFIHQKNSFFFLFLLISPSVITSQLTISVYQVVMLTISQHENV